MPVIQLPFHFKPRPYQLPFFRAMDNGLKRAVLVHHRRAGKDKSAFNYMVKEAFKRVGVYYYFFPTYNQGRKVLWDGIDKEGFKFLDHVPKELRKGDPNQTEMKLNLINGSIIQVVGSDNVDTIVGTNPVGCVFSEYPLQDPSGWDFVRPILRENGGWAIFPYTPRGKNHGYDLYAMAKDNPDWFCQLLSVNDTFGHGGTVGPEDVEAERKSGMSENLIQQEYMCFPVNTRIWTREGQRVIQDIRIGDVVLSHAGRWRKVTKLFRSKNTEKMIEVKSSGSCKPLVCTENHQIRVCYPPTQTYKWIQAKDIKIGQYVVLPRLKLQESEIIDSSIAELIAWYIAEGSVAKTAVQFSLHSKEEEFAERIIASTASFGKTTIHKSKDSKGMNVVVNSAQLADFLTTNCGSGAANKHIPWSLIAGHEELVYNTLIDGDGCRGDYHGPNEVYTTISYSLALDVQMLANMLGKRANVNSVPGGKVTVFPNDNACVCSESYSVRVSEIRKTINGRPKLLPQKHGVAACITEVKILPPCDEVFNLSVQFDESYIAEGRVVHNCSFDAAVENAVFGEQMHRARTEGRITSVPYQSGVPVNTYWDIGRDGTAIWFIQAIRNEVRVINCFSSHQSELAIDLVALQNMGYVYGTHFFPHDGDYRDYKSGKTPKEVASNLGFNVEIVDKISKTAQIDAARSLFNRCWFDEKNCQRGLDALASWHFAWDEKLRILSPLPVHDWSSHFGDSWCQVALKHEDESIWSPRDRYSKKKKRNYSAWAA